MNSYSFSRRGSAFSATHPQLNDANSLIKGKIAEKIFN